VNKKRVAPEALTSAAGDVRVFVDALGRLGYDAESLVAGAGVDRADLDSPDGRIPCAALGAILDQAMRQRPLQNLAMRIAAETPIGAFPLIDYLIVTSEGVGAGLKQFARYSRLVGSQVVPHIHDHEEPVRIVYEGSPNPFAFEFGISLCILHLREETEGRFRVEQVSFTHRPDDVPEMERVLGCAVRPEAAWNGWTMTRDSCELPFRRRDPILRRVLEHQANEIMARLPAMSAVALEVRRVLASRVAGGDTRIGAVARALTRSTRSLQRQLGAEGCSYQELVDLTRKEAAERYLADSSLPIAEVAYLLGYSEPAAFHRAFKRWNDETPLAFRLGHGAARMP
jgi:AraC-like DNA-binding protein